MFYNTSTAASKSSVEILTTSTGLNPAGWREFWRAESARVGTDWHSLLHQHHRVFQQLCQATIGASS
jgi:hypothetical protein